MSYFDDIEDYSHRTLRYFNRRPQPIHYTEESFIQNVDGRFEIRKTVCGLEFSQSSGRVTPKSKRITCKECLKKIHIKLEKYTENA